MRVTERDKKRLIALIAIVRPANSFAARRETLTDQQREDFDGWKACCDRYIQQHPNGDAYAKYLNGYGPWGRLRQDVSLALFGEPSRIPITDDENAAMQKYRKLCDG